MFGVKKKEKTPLNERVTPTVGPDKKVETKTPKSSKTPKGGVKSRKEKSLPRENRSDSEGETNGKSPEEEELDEELLSILNNAVVTGSKNFLLFQKPKEDYMRRVISKNRSKKEIKDAVLGVVLDMEKLERSSKNLTYNSYRRNELDEFARDISMPIYNTDNTKVLKEDLVEDFYKEIKKWRKTGGHRRAEKIKHIIVNNNNMPVKELDKLIFNNVYSDEDEIEDDENSDEDEIEDDENSDEDEIEDDENSDEDEIEDDENSDEDENSEISSRERKIFEVSSEDEDNGSFQNSTKNRELSEVSSEDEQRFEDSNAEEYSDDGLIIDDDSYVPYTYNR